MTVGRQRNSDGVDTRLPKNTNPKRAAGGSQTLFMILS